MLFLQYCFTAVLHLILKFVRTAQLHIYGFLAICLAILSVIQLGINYKKNDNGSVEIYKDKRKFFTLLILLIIYALLISYFGFMLSTALFLPLTMVMMGHKKKITIILASAGLLLFIQFLFVSLLQVPLPEGLIFG